MAIQENEFVFFPFIGFLESDETFEYLPLTIHHDQVEIAIVKWLVNRTILNLGDKISIYVPHQSKIYKHLVKNVTGTITSVKEHEEMQGTVYGITIKEKDNESHIDLPTLNDFIKKLSADHSLIELLEFFVKDSKILKEGVQIYIKHLIPFFSRIVDFQKTEYLQIKESFLLDILQKIQQNIDKLILIQKQLTENLKNIDDIPIYIGLEELREILESEINVNLFEIIFGNKQNLQPSSRTQIQSNFSINMYIDAIKALERRVYANYNSIVIIYLKSLGGI